MSSWLLRNSINLLPYRFALVGGCLLLFSHVSLVLLLPYRVYGEAQHLVPGSTWKNQKRCGIKHFCGEQGTQGRSVRKFANSTSIITVFPRTDPLWVVLPRTGEGIDVSPPVLPRTATVKAVESALWQHRLARELGSRASQRCRFPPQKCMLRAKENEE